MFPSDLLRRDTNHSYHTMNQDTDKNIEFSSITLLTTEHYMSESDSFDNIEAANTIFIHSSTTSRISKSDVSCATTASLSSKSSGHTHSLSPSTNSDHPLFATMSTQLQNDVDVDIESTKHPISDDNDTLYAYNTYEEKQHILSNHSNPYKHLEQQMIHNYNYNMQSSGNSHSDGEHCTAHRPKRKRKKKRRNKRRNKRKHKKKSKVILPDIKTHAPKRKKVPMHPPNIVTTKYPSAPPPPVPHPATLQLHSPYSYSNTCTPIHAYYTPPPCMENTTYYHTTPSPMNRPPLILQQYDYDIANIMANMAAQSKSNYSFFAYNHDNGSMHRLTPVSIDTHTPISSSPACTGTTPLYSCAYTPSKSTQPQTCTPTFGSTIQSMHSNVNVQKYESEREHEHLHGEYWDLAQYDGQKYLLTDFAAEKFQVRKHKKTSIFSKNCRKSKDVTFLEHLFSFSPYKKMKHSLLAMETREMDKIGMQIWKNINGFMELRKSSKFEQQHIDTILQIALDSNDMIKDEIFCQIVKQTNYNCNNNKKIDIEVYKLIKGWQLMCICCSIFCPSPQFVKYLACYLCKQSKDITFGDGKMSEMATFALHALDNTMIAGSRHIEPLPLEINCIQNCKSIPIKIYFLDNTFLTFNINSQTSTKQLCHSLVSKLKLNANNCDYFALYECEEIPMKKYNDYVLKLYNCRLDMNYNQKVQHLNNLLIDRELNANERIMDVYSSWQRYSNKKNKHIRLVYKCRIFNKCKMNINPDLFTSNEWKLMFLNEFYNVMCNKYPINSGNDLLHLAAIQMQAEYDHITAGITTKYGRKQCKPLILQKQYQFYKDLTPKQCYVRYINYLLQLNDANLFVGCVFFYCVCQINHNDFIIGINDDSLLIIHPPTKKIIDRYMFEQIISYGFKTNSFVFVAGSVLTPQKYQFATSYGKEINHLLQQYIEIRTRR